MIYVFIAASYFPWLTIQPFPLSGWTAELWWIVWVLASLGILYQQLFHERYKCLETCFYLFMGIVPSIAIIGMVSTQYIYNSVDSISESETVCQVASVHLETFKQWRTSDLACLKTSYLKRYQAQKLLIASIAQGKCIEYLGWFSGKLTFSFLQYSSTIESFIISVCKK
jgi:hypothetical protein